MNAVPPGFDSWSDEGRALWHAGESERRRARAELAPPLDEPPSIDYAPPGEAARERSTVVFKTAAEFAKEFQPPRYIIEKIAQGGYIYTLTARTGTGKTAWLASAALATAANMPRLVGSPVTAGRVVFLTFENPDDVRMRLMVAAHHADIWLDDLGDELLVLDARTSPEDVYAGLLARRCAGDFSLVIVDTLQAAFDGQDSNDAVSTGAFIRRCRVLNSLPGRPAVIVAAHPVKNASDDNLTPYGSGAVLNEVDGNLTLGRDGSGVVTLHWQGKFRGVNFDPRLYKIDLLTSPDVIDANGVQMQMPVMAATIAEAAEAKAQEAVDGKVSLMRAMRATPDATQRDWAITIGRSTSTINAYLHDLKAKKLAHETLGRWRLTKLATAFLDGNSGGE